MITWQARSPPGQPTTVRQAGVRDPGLPQTRVIGAVGGDHPTNDLIGKDATVNRQATRLPEGHLVPAQGGNAYFEAKK